MRIAICQPTYLPWVGYFDLMDQVGAFVILDTVQFEKQSWQQRNRVKTPAGLQWLTVPVVFRGRLGQKIQDVEIRDLEFGRKHLRAIELNYRRAPFFEKYYRGISSVLEEIRENDGTERLAVLNLRLLEWLAGILGISTPLILASSLGVDGKRTELLANICRRLGSTEYLSPVGSAVYLLAEIDILASAGINVAFHNYDHPEYRQLFPPFLAFASVVDLVFNEGERSGEIMRSGRKIPLPPEKVAGAMIEASSPRLTEN